MTNFILKPSRYILCAAATAAALGWSAPVTADPNAGAYLAARQAGLEGNFPEAARYFRSALLADAGNMMLMEQTLTALLGMGEVEQAARLAQTFNDAGGDSQIGNIALFADFVRNEDWDAIFDLLEAGHEIGPLIDGLGQAWAYFGQGKMDDSLMSFDEVIDTPGFSNFGNHHKAIALALVGDLEAAEAIYARPPNEGFIPSRDSVIAHIKILARLDRFDDAKALLTRAFDGALDPELTGIKTALDANEIPRVDGMIATPADGISFAFISLSEILQGEANEGYLLLYGQAARHMTPDAAMTHIATARILNALGQYEQAAQTFAQVGTEDKAYHSAEIGRAEALRLAGKLDPAIEVLTQLARSHPDMGITYASLGDIYRQKEDYEAAKNAYDDALQTYPEDASIRWWLLYSRGIAFESMDQWPQAEADFRASLELNPGNPSVLNYLGYSLVDRGIRDSYDEALVMIEEAVAARPDSGAIVDSLAWVYYKLGRYQDAVEPMERATTLIPNDPILSDHLGDVYWMVGRETEARFQWRRALSFNPEEDEAIRIRRKLAIGLDAVYVEEGVTPAPAVEVEVARDN